MNMLPEAAAPPKPPRGGKRVPSGQPGKPFRFTRLVRAAGPYFVATEIHEDRQVADGFVPARTLVVRATFSIDEARALARLEVRFDVSQGRAPAFHRTANTVNARARLSRAWRDDEDLLAHLRADSSIAGDSEAATKAIAVDLWRTLQDPDVSAFITAEPDDVGSAEEGGVV